MDVQLSVDKPAHLLVWGSTVRYIEFADAKTVVDYAVDVDVDRFIVYYYAFDERIDDDKPPRCALRGSTFFSTRDLFENGTPGASFTFPVCTDGYHTADLTVTVKQVLVTDQARWPAKQLVPRDAAPFMKNYKAELAHFLNTDIRVYPVPNTPWVHGTSGFMIPPYLDEVQMPQWFFPYVSYARDVPEARDSEVFERLLEWAVKRLGPEASSIELVGEAASFIPLAADYRPDEVDGQSIEQWGWLSLFRQWEVAGCDCEDVAEYATRILNKMHKTTNPGPLLKRVQEEVFKFYEFCMCVCVLKDTPEHVLYHCAVIGVDRLWLNVRMATRTPKCKYEPQRQPFIIETTEWCAMEDRFASPPVLHGLSPAQRDAVHVRLPSTAHLSSKYPQIISLLTPQHVDAAGRRVTEIYFHQGQSLGAAPEALHEADARVFMLKDMEERAALKVCLEAIPPFQPIPLLNPVNGPEPDAANKGSTYWLREDYLKFVRIPPQDVKRYQITDSLALCEVSLTKAPR